MVTAMAFRGPVRGVISMLRAFMGPTYHKDADGTLQEVHSIDFIIVGLGLILLVLVLLRR